MMMMTTSICIPRVDAVYTPIEIKNIIETLRIGVVKTVDMIYNKKSQTKTAFVHFDTWCMNERSQNIKKYIEEKDDHYVKIMYSFPWYWKCYRMKSKKKY